ncbi:ATP-dependent DNA ligase [Leifsonia sp. NPDC080035]|uniref:ATP-dependent DNA ligase n=1 Tax=Leifsonia sp. NPDC080035 TaxID=3143936 RepID=A0AAU7GGI2_9MICO
MGSLTYDSMVIEFEDRLLLHLQIVIVNKLRRRESFAMSWRDAAEVGDGRSTIWLDPSIPLYFKFSGSRVPAVDRDWVELLADSAGSSTGLVVVDEDGKPEVAGRCFGVAAAAPHLAPTVRG